MNTASDIVGELRAVCDSLEHVSRSHDHEDAADATRREEVYRGAARRLRQMATALDRQSAQLVMRHSIPGAMTGATHAETMRGDREITFGTRRLPVRVETIAPIELLALSPGGMDGADSIEVELHNPASQPYHVHGTLLFIGGDGDVIANDSFMVDALEPLRTDVREHTVPSGTERLDLIVIASVT